jgi:hypothetical protein
MRPQPMRLPLVSLIALAAAANAYAQAPATAPPASAPASPPSASSPTQAPPGAVPAAPVGQAPATAPGGDTGAPAAAPPAPPAPPPPPTDPTAIELLSVLQSVCIPAANGGNFVQLAKTAGLRKQGDQGWALKTKDYTLLVANPGSNPDQCHVEITHPADLDSPGRPIIVALNDWATGAANGWSLYRNDKSVQEGMQFTTRSWQLDWNGKEQSLVFTTKRKSDGSPLHPNVDESEMIYGVAKTG